MSESQERFEIHVGKDSLVFCAAHFITYGGGCCETLHGHNYRVGVRLAGDLDPHGLIHDFLDLEARLRGIVEPLDHRTLLPESNPHLELARDDGTVTVRFEEREYRFPEEDVVILPVSNTTAERLAAWMAERLTSELAEAEGVDRLKEVEVEVEESFGKSSFYTRSV